MLKSKLPAQGTGLPEAKDGEKMMCVSQDSQK